MYSAIVLKHIFFTAEFWFLFYCFGKIFDPEDSIRVEKENGKDKDKGKEVKDRQKSVKKIGHRRVDETGQVSYKKVWQSDVP